MIGNRAQTTPIGLCPLLSTKKEKTLSVKHQFYLLGLKRVVKVKLKVNQV